MARNVNRRLSDLEAAARELPRPGSLTDITPEFRAAMHNVYGVEYQGQPILVRDGFLALLRRVYDNDKQAPE